MELVEVFKEYIKPELVVLIPVMYLIGLGIKKASIKDALIPFILGPVAIVLCGLYVFATSDIANAKDVATALFTAITQGILTAGASVYANQLYKQYLKKDE